MYVELADEMIHSLLNGAVSAAEILRHQMGWEHGYE
jgi:hypothetical protein